MNTTKTGNTLPWKKSFSGFNGGEVYELVFALWKVRLLKTPSGWIIETDERGSFGVHLEEINFEEADLQVRKHLRNLLLKTDEKLVTGKLKLQEFPDYHKTI